MGRIYRHPFRLFGIGPAYLFLLQQRLPVGFMRGGWRPWFSAMVTNLAIVLVSATMIWAVGLGPFLLVHLPITLLGASIGVWQVGSQSYVPPEGKDDKALNLALNLMRGVQSNPAFPPKAKTADVPH